MFGLPEQLCTGLHAGLHGVYARFAVFLTTRPPKTEPECLETVDGTPCTIHNFQWPETQSLELLRKVSPGGGTCKQFTRMVKPANSVRNRDSSVWQSYGQGAQLLASRAAQLKAAETLPDIDEAWGCICSCESCGCRLLQADGRS